MSEVTTSDVRMMLGVAIFLFSIAICLVPWFFVGSGTYQVGVFSAGLAVFALSFGYLLV